DPRQLNPEIPGEVVALLGRMMAKDRDQRYQHPEELVQHLFVLAQKLGAVSEVPEGLLFLEAPLPGPSRTRPMVLAIVSMAALVAVITFFGPGTSRSNRRGAVISGSATASGPVDADASQKPPRSESPQKVEDPPVRATEVAATAFHPGTAEELA